MQIEKQDNGKYAIWSTIVDDYLYVDCDRDKLIEVYMEEAREDVVRSVDRQIARLEKKG
jgi:hypothetical protein